MGFYGNITNTSKTNFVFDKIYTNRKAMDNNIDKDGIFIGRYVLVEYGEITEDSFIRAYGPQTDGYYHISNDNEVTTRILYTTEPIPSKDNYIKKGQIIYILGIGGKYEFLECNGGANKGKPTFTENPGLDPKTDPYFYNLKQDQAEYNVSRGYDGTVWIKTSVNNEIKYVNIAELNSVVPSFEMVADAPTMSPILPHFDTASNNVYYKLHWQPAWGMRIAETTDGSDKFSDYITSWSQEVYNKETGEIFTQWYFPNQLQEDGKTKGVWRALKAEEQPPTINADIYFNHAAFDSQIGETTINKDVNYRPITLTSSTYVAGKYYYKSGNSYFPDNRGFNSSRNPYYEKLENYIGITADGLSGNEYNLHDNTSGAKQLPDTQQIHINLPAIGNMMSEAWDIIHGEKRDNSTVDSLQGRLNFFKDEIAHNEIPIQSSETEGYLVGSVINGAISYENSTDATNQDESVYNKNILNVAINSEKPYEHDDAWIATNIDTNQGKDGDKDYHRKAISIHHTFHKRDDSTVNELNINDYDGKNGGSEVDSDTKFQKIIDKDTIQLYVPKVDKAGHVVGTDIDKVVLPYGYKHIETNGKVDETNTADLYTTITSVSNEDDTEVKADVSNNQKSCVANNTQDTLNIQTQNKWIQTAITNNNSGADSLVIAHEIHAIKDADATGTNLNGGNISTVTSDNIVIPDLKFDKAGHLTENHSHTYTLPYGYKTIATNGRGTSTIENASTTPSKSNIVAENTQDTLNINSGNKWIRIDTNISSDTLTIAHDIHNTSNTTSTKSLVSETAATTFDVPTYNFDEAGHYISHDTKTITVPYGYGKITGDNGSTSATATFDTLAINADDAWIETTVSKDKVNITHTGPVTGTPVTVANVEPEFGETFSITDWQYDSKGHKYGSTTHTVKMPDGSYTPANAATTHTDIITSLGFTPKTGAITSTKANTDTLTLHNYSANSGNLDIKATDTINTGLEKIQNHINGLDMSSTSTTDFITEITQTDGQIVVKRAKAGTLVLGKENADYSVSETASAIVYNDSLATAFGKVEAQIKAETAARQKEIADLINSAPEALDTLGEVADWINNDETGAAAMTNDIAILKGTDTTNGSVKKSIKDAIAGLDSSVVVSNNSVNYLTGITIDDGKITGKTEGTLGSAAFTESTNYATAAQGILADTAIQLDTEIAYKIQNDDGEGNIVEEELKTTIEEMAKEIASLKQVLKDNGLITE